jgi:cytoplasmic tRNA 2-thiolation protein 1
LDYFSTECVYSPNAYRGYARDFLKDLEAIRPSAILGIFFILFLTLQICDNKDIIKSAELLNFKESTKQLTTGACERCAYSFYFSIPLLVSLHQFSNFLSQSFRYISSNKICKACVMLESLNRGKPRLALQKEKMIAREDKKDKSDQIS